MNRSHKPIRHRELTGKALFLMRERAGLTITQIAADLGIHPRTYQHWEAGRPIGAAMALLVRYYFSADCRAP